MRFNITVLLCVLLLTACTNNNAPSTSATPTSTPTESLTSLPTVSEEPNDEVEEQEPEGKTHLFSPIPVYNESEVITIELDNQQLKTTFSKERVWPFGFYLPDSMEVIQFEDGTEWSIIGEYAKISIDLYNNDVEQFTLQNEDLTSYNEYVASETSYDNMRDYFIFEHNEEKYQIKVFYIESEKEKILPLLLKVIETIRYTGES